MKCESVVRLIDDFVYDELNQRDRNQVEEHLARCPGCARELRKQPALERDVRRALAAQVRPLYISADVSSRIVQAAEESLSRAGRARRTMLTVRVVSGALAVLLVAIGVLALLGRIPVPSNLASVSLVPAKRLPPVEPGLESVLGADRPRPQMETPTLSQLEASMLIEPRDLHARQPFTITVYVQSDLPEPMDSMDMDLDIAGPTGSYRFELSFGGPLPAEGTSVFSITPGLLTGPCEERYLMSPADIFAVPGAYTVRVTLLHPVVIAD
ncbi:MAG: anti-sigma factor family protein [Anaerolineae bacterium]